MKGSEMDLKNLWSRQVCVALHMSYLLFVLVGVSPCPFCPALRSFGTETPWRDGTTVTHHNTALMWGRIHMQQARLGRVPVS